MKLIADSGSTKADWVLVQSPNNFVKVHTKGLNPMFLDTEEMIAALKDSDFTNLIPLDKVAEVYFYGAGCWDKERKMVIARALTHLLPNAKVEVEHDLLAAARAACGRSPGVACILGTGSNSCLYDGVNVLDNVTNLAYLLGDEGSGTHLGKKLIRSRAYREMPNELAVRFDTKYPEGVRGILNTIYTMDAPNTYLGSFAEFYGANKDHVFIQQLVAESFGAFIDAHVRKYDGHLKLPISFVGSIAYHFKDILKSVLNRRAMDLGQIVRRPIDSLVEFHTATSLTSGH